MGKALAQDGYREKAFLMTKDCAHDRKAHHSMGKLEQSLHRLQTDYLDLWQIHEVVWEDDPDWIFAPGGSAEALLKAKEQGKVRYIGFTGHKHPDIHKRMLSQGFPFDAVQMPLNVLDAHYASFEREIVPHLPGAGHRRPGDEEFCRRSPLQERRRHHPPGGAALRDEPAGRDRRLRHGLAGDPGAEPGGRPRLHPADGGGADGDPGQDGAGRRRRRFERFKTTGDFEGGEGRKAHNVPLRSVAAD